MRPFCLSLSALLLMLILSDDSQARNRCRHVSSSPAIDIPTKWVEVRRVRITADVLTESVGFAIHSAKMEQVLDPKTKMIRSVMFESVKPEFYISLRSGSGSMESFDMVIRQFNLVTENGLLPLNTYSFTIEKAEQPRLAPMKNEASR